MKNNVPIAIKVGFTSESDHKKHELLQKILKPQKAPQSNIIDFTYI